jgi:hypothetical protein
MKLGSLIIAFLLTSSAFAHVSLDVNFKDFTKKQVTGFKQIIRTDLDEVSTISLPASKQVIEITVSENLPLEVKKLGSSKYSTLISLRLFDLLPEGRKLVNSGKIVTGWGKTASMKKFSKASKNPLMTLTVVPKKI